MIDEIETRVEFERRLNKKVIKAFQCLKDSKDEEEVNNARKILINNHERLLYLVKIGLIEIE